VVTAIVKANAEFDKRDSLLALRDRPEELTLLVRLGKEVGAFRSFKSYSTRPRKWFRSAGRTRGGYGV
jgi:hypothetical protein